MPEMLEVEAYRLAADPVVGRTIERVHAPDEWFIKGATSTESLLAELPGRRVLGTRRIGKLMLIDTDGPVLGLRYGMTGRILVDDDAPIAALEYSSDRSSVGSPGSTSAKGVRSSSEIPTAGRVELDPDEMRGSRCGGDVEAVPSARLIIVGAVEGPADGSQACRPRQPPRRRHPVSSRACPRPSGELVGRR